MPTVITESIGSVGRDYTTPIAWEAATDNNLVSADEVRVGQAYADSVFTNQGVCVFIGATTDATRYRVCEAAPGHEYDPITDTGVRYNNNGNCLIVNEDYFQLRHWGAQNTISTSTGNRHVFNTWTTVTTEVLYDGCVSLGHPNSSSSFNYALQVAGITGTVKVRNCMFVSEGGGLDDTIFGIWAGDPVEVYNCGFFEISGATASVGIKLTAGSDGSVIRNCIAIDCDTDFNQDAQSPELGTWDYNGSSDSTATDLGSNSLDTLVHGDVWEDAFNKDFRPKAASVTNDAGVDLSGTFTNSLDPGVDHGTGANSDWEMGPYNYFASEGGALMGVHLRLV
jgi:hypothetical protein